MRVGSHINQSKLYIHIRVKSFPGMTHNTGTFDGNQAQNGGALALGMDGHFVTNKIGASPEHLCSSTRC